MNETFGTSIEAPAGTPLREGVANAATEFERLSSGADKNPISQRVRDAGDDPTPPADRPALQGGAPANESRGRADPSALSRSCRGVGLANLIRRAGRAALRIWRLPEVRRSCIILLVNSVGRA